MRKQLNIEFIQVLTIIMNVYLKLLKRLTLAHRKSINFKLLVVLFLVAFNVNSQQSPPDFVVKVYDDIYQVMRTRTSPKKPAIYLSNNNEEIALYTPSLNQIEIGQKFIDMARSFGKDSLNVVAQILSHELAHVLLEQSTIIKKIGSGYASKEFNKRLKKTHATLRDTLYERQADEYSFFYAQIAGFNTKKNASKVLDTIYKQWGFKDKDLKRYPTLDERKLIAQTAINKMELLNELFDIAILSNIVGKHNLAIDLFQFILDEDFDSREIHNNLGTSYLLKGITQLDKKVYPYIFPVQIDLETKLNSERVYNIKSNAYIESALVQFKFALEGHEIYPTALLNKSICEFLLEKDDFEITMFRLSKIKDIYIQSNFKLMYTINNHFQNKDSLVYKRELALLSSNNSIAKANYLKFLKKDSISGYSIPTGDTTELKLPDFDFIFNDEARKSDTLKNVFGSNTRDFSFRKIENENWEALRIKSSKSYPSSRLILYKYVGDELNIEPEKFDTPNFETKNYLYFLGENKIYLVERFDRTKSLYFYK